MMFLSERAGWVECWTVPSVVFTIDYSWHPIYPQKADEQLKQSRKCHYFFLVSMFHFRNCCDFVGSKCLNLQKWILNWTTILCHMGEYASLECTSFVLKTDNVSWLKNFRKCPSSLCKKRILSVVHSSLSLTKCIS